MEVYSIRNTINNKRYIGKTEKRFSSRYGAKWWNNLSNRMLKKDVLKYGHRNFEIEILEIVNEDKVKLERRERFWTKKLNSVWPNGYNLMLGDLGKHHDESKKQISKTMLSDEFRMANKRLFLKQKETQCAWCKSSVISYQVRGKYKKFCSKICRYSQSIDNLIALNRYNDKKVVRVMQLLDQEKKRGGCNV